MDKLRELTGFVQRFGGNSGGIGNGGGNVNNGPEDCSNIRRKDLLPRRQVEQTAKENEEKAAEALKLLQRVDELVESHTTTAASLTTFLSQLSTLPIALSQANDLAQSIHTQLTTLSALISSEESALECSHLKSLQLAEDLKFSTYAVDRRVALERKKEGYASQLDAFRKERGVW
ncbi:hypothetical protein BGX38DRAFT_675898 [Terfezia claveryi]|nr:hypothetical protein BGX38DRAFT_675898 [Terfezia claveryi]